jgi:hypothetical protein
MVRMGPDRRQRSRSGSGRWSGENPKCGVTQLGIVEELPRFVADVIELGHRAVFSLIFNRIAARGITRRG